MRKLLAAIALMFGGVAVAPGAASAAFTCGQMTSGGGGDTAWISCSSIQPPEWFQIWINCSLTGTTRYKGNKVYVSNEQSIVQCAPGMGIPSVMNWYHSA